MNRRHLFILCGSLALAGLAIFLYKVFALGFPLTPGGRVELWSIEARVTFVGKKEPVRVALHIPNEPDQFILLDESFISFGYGLNTMTKDGQRQAVWTTRREMGKQGLYYRALVRPFERNLPKVKETPPVELPVFEEQEQEAVTALLIEMLDRSADTESLVKEILKAFNARPLSGSVEILLGKSADAVKKAETVVKVLSFNRIPARIVRGVQLKEQRKPAPILTWIEVFYDEQWRSFDLLTGVTPVAGGHLPWWRGTELLATGKGIDRLEVGLSVSSVQEEAVSAALNMGRVEKVAVTALSLYVLPQETQAVYRILLMIPVGAFLLTIFRNVIGVKTFGTFMPVLIALAFRQTQLVWGIALFTFIVALGLSVRFYFEHLKLLLVPRLAALLIVVVLLMAIFSLLSYKLGLERGLSVALFPMVILTMTIERMCIVWEERGAEDAFQQGIGSLAVAAVAYLVMFNPYTEHLFFVFPELLLVLLSLTLLLGRYTGYRLLEVFRFRSLAEDGK